MSLPRFLLFDYCYSVLCNEGIPAAQRTDSANFPTQLECALYAELDEPGSFDGEQWQFYLRQFDPHCADCNLHWAGRTADAKQAATKPTTIDHGDCAELDRKNRLWLSFVVDHKLKLLADCFQRDPFLIFVGQTVTAGPFAKRN